MTTWTWYAAGLLTALLLLAALVALYALIVSNTSQDHEEQEK